MSTEEGDAIVEDHLEGSTKRDQPMTTHHATRTHGSNLDLRKRSHLKDIKEEDEDSGASRRSSISKEAFDGNNNPPSSHPRPSPVSLTPRDEYINCLNHWLVSVQAWKSYRECLAATLLASTLSSQMSSTASPATQTNQSPPVDTSRVVRIPKLWKRILAEVIDFFLLLVIKIVVTYIAIDFFDLIDLEKFDLSVLEFNLLESISTTGMNGFADEDLEEQLSEAYRLAYEMTSEILVMESIHRVIVIAYEAIFLSYNWFGRRRNGQPVIPGGATPGKFMMGLKVISARAIEPVVVSGEEVLRVSPAQDMGCLWSLLRAVIKNFSSIFFLPASLTVFLSRFNRAAYDAVCGCIVVEEVV